MLIVVKCQVGCLTNDSLRSSYKSAFLDPRIVEVSPEHGPLDGDHVPIENFFFWRSS
jgi:hypothetical protein